MQSWYLSIFLHQHISKILKIPPQKARKSQYFKQSISHFGRFHSFNWNDIPILICIFSLYTLSMGKTWFNLAKNWIISLQLDQESIHKVIFYPSDNNLTQVLLVTNIISGYGSLWKGRSWQLPFDIQVEMLYFSSLFWQNFLESVSNQLFLSFLTEFSWEDFRTLVGSLLNRLLNADVLSQSAPAPSLIALLLYGWTDGAVSSAANKVRRRRSARSCRQRRAADGI